MENMVEIEGGHSVSDHNVAVQNPADGAVVPPVATAPSPAESSAETSFESND